MRNCRVSVLIVAAALSILPSTGSAGCHCQADAQMVMASPHVGMSFMQPMVYSAYQAETFVPPGTLGQTYTRPSHAIPVREHPRNGMLAIRDNEAVPYMSVQEMGGFRMKNGIWLFESVRPLDVGVEQIVRVEARRTDKDIEPYSTRFVRLIPGRIVYLDF